MMLSGPKRDILEHLCFDVKQYMASCKDTSTTLNFYCPHGKDWSVACCELFALIFGRLGLTVEVVHKSLQRHRRECRCDSCERPDRFNEVVALVLMEVYQEAEARSRS